MPKRHRIIFLLVLTWAPLVILSAFGDVRFRSGGRVTLSLLVDYTVYVRFLLAVPVLVYAEGVIWPRVVDSVPLSRAGRRGRRGRRACARTAD